MEFSLYLCALILLVGKACYALPSMQKSKSDVSMHSKWDDLFLIDQILNEEKVDLDDEFVLDEVQDELNLDSEIWSNCGKLHVHSH